eukprot:CAMPEP_0172599356 /NCGR_PEP_ID=MMETSP1068-20121228/19434_1 /TAXON_ID=35684 /ORGANISM="Pseudopedinella elastica, Strain CCMP716" /LENGTH=109 /DNA_ID=CAMNT_0013399581 /DNA_START=157 /DNA_END=482 /DNA_ORIENTATION=+
MDPFFLFNFFFFEGGWVKLPRLLLAFAVVVEGGQEESTLAGVPDPHPLLEVLLLQLLLVPLGGPLVKGRRDRVAPPVALAPPDARLTAAGRARRGPGGARRGVGARGHG